MRAKEQVRELLERLPDDCSLDDVLYHIYVIRAVERGLEESERGSTIPQSEVERNLREKWLLGAAE